MTGVLTALGNQWESRIATLLESSRAVHIVRRCADLADLVATASAGLGSVALVSGDLRGLDLSAVAQLREVGVAVVGVVTSDDEDAERRLRQLGVDRVVPGGADLVAFEAALSEQASNDHSGTGLGELALLDPDREPTASGPRAPSDGGGSPAWPGSGIGAGQVTTGLGPLDGDAPPSPEDAAPGRIVAVWGPTGAPGRTTIAVTLASELAVLGITAVLVDADTYGGSVGQALSFLDEAPGIAAATRAADQGTLDLPMLARLSPVASPGLRVITGIPKAERWTEIRAAALERVLTLSRQLGQVVVVDCGFNLEDDEELS